MKRLVAILFLFVGFALMLLGAFFVFIWLLLLYARTPSGNIWSIAPLGLGLILGGWVIKRWGLCLWRSAAVGNSGPLGRPHRSVLALSGMRRCSYCGKEYDDTAIICDLDQQPVVQVPPAAEGISTLSNPSLEFLRLLFKSPKE